MNSKTVFSLYKKEILDIFRDKKTVIIMLVVPLLLYPAIFFFAAQISVSIINDAQTKTYNVALDFDDGREEIERIMLDENDDYDYSFNILKSIENCSEALADGEIDAYITLDSSGEKPVYNIWYLSSSSDSANVVTMLEDIILEYRNVLRTDALDASGLDADTILYPVDVQQNDTASSEQSIGYLLGSILPVILVVIIVMSASYPAIDITAGEKERGTLETLLTLPLKGSEIFFSKFMAVSTITIFSAFINIISMTVVTSFMYKSIITYSSSISIDISTFIPAFLIVLLCVVFFSMFISAVAMGICSFAKSFKEAQNYMTPFTLIIMLVGYLSFIPSVELTSVTATIPVLNICLLIKQLLAFEYNFTFIFIIFVSNILYSAVSIIILSRMYNSENIMFEEGGNEIKLFERRANIKSGGTPGKGDALIILLVSLMFMIYSSVIIVSKSDIIYSIIIPQIFFVLICFSSALYLKCDIKKTFSIKMPSPLQIAGAIFMGIGMIMLNLIITSLLSPLMRDSFGDMSQSMKLIMEGRSTAELIIIIGFIPAVCEEILFRGYLYSSVRYKLRPVYAMLIVSVVFGIYHMNVIQSVVTALIGMLLVFSVYKTDCIFISMIMHFMNNSFSVIGRCYPESLFISIIENISFIQVIVGALSIILGLMAFKKSENKMLFRHS